MKLPKRFSAYLVTQSLGAFNDNFFKMLLQLYVVQIIAVDNTELQKEIIAQTMLIFNLPFVLFGPYAGYLADRFPKSTIMKATKFAEIGIMVLGVYAFYLGNISVMLVVLFLMTTQSTFFGPAKYGYIPEVVKPAAVTSANSWVEMTTFVAILLGAALTGIVFDFHQQDSVVVAVYCVLIAALGIGSALWIRPVPPINASIRFPWNPFVGIFRNVRSLQRQKKLWIATLSNSYFWMLGLLFQSNIIIFGKHILGESSLSSVWLTIMPAFLGVGIIFGAMLASRWSGNKVELGLTLIGGVGLAFSGIGLYFVNASYWGASAIVLLAGVSGGLYIVPLYAYLQFYARENEKGRVLSTLGVLNGIFLVLGSLLYQLLAVNLAFSAETLYLFLGIATLLVMGVLCRVVPEYRVRAILWIISHFFYRVKIRAAENIPLRGPAILLVDAREDVDPLLIGAAMQENSCFVWNKSPEDINSPLLKALFRLLKMIWLKSAGGTRGLTEALNSAAGCLQDGQILCVFLENLNAETEPDTEDYKFIKKILDGSDVPVIPVSVANPKTADSRGRRFLQKFLILFGAPLYNSGKNDDFMRLLKQLSDRSIVSGRRA